jgi:hypothetical protein
MVQFYDRAKQLGSTKAQMRLAVITQMPIKKAETEPDSPGNIQLFQNAMKELEKEFK